MYMILSSLFQSTAILSLIVSCVIFLLCFYKVRNKIHFNIAEIDEINTDLDIMETFNVQNQKRVVKIIKYLELIEDHEKDRYLINIKNQLSEILELLRHNCFLESNSAYNINELESKLTLYTENKNKI